MNFAQLATNINLNASFFFVCVCGYLTKCGRAQQQSTTDVSLDHVFCMFIDIADEISIKILSEFTRPNFERKERPFQSIPLMIS